MNYAINNNGLFEICQTEKRILRNLFFDYAPMAGRHQNLFSDYSGEFLYTKP